MIQLVVLNIKKNKQEIENYSNIHEAEERLNVIGPKLKVNEKINPKAKYLLLGGSADTKAEVALITPYLFPDKEEDD